MQANEISAWVSHHAVAFPGWGQWFDKLTEGRQVDCMEFWSKSFDGLSLQSLKDATEQLYNSENQPKSYDRHAWIVERLARAKTGAEKTSRTIAKFGHGTVGCLDCQDTGLVTVAVIRTLRDGEKVTITSPFDVAAYVLSYGEDPNEFYTAALPCYCHSAKPIKGSAIYNEQRFVRLDETKTGRSESGFWAKIQEKMFSGQEMCSNI